MSQGRVQGCAVLGVWVESVAASRGKIRWLPWTVGHAKGR